MIAELSLLLESTTPTFIDRFVLEALFVDGLIDLEAMLLDLDCVNDDDDDDSIDVLFACFSLFTCELLSPLAGPVEGAVEDGDASLIEHVSSLVCRCKVVLANVPKFCLTKL